MSHDAERVTLLAQRIETGHRKPRDEFDAACGGHGDTFRAGGRVVSDLSEDGRAVTPELVEQIIEEEMAALAGLISQGAWMDGRFGDACALFRKVATGNDLIEFLTIPAYRMLTE